jgi:hypothetical protein
MTTKREELTKIINVMIKYGKEHKMPYFDNNMKINQFKQKYTTDHCAGLIVKYMIPAHEQNMLKGYLHVEMERLRMMAVMSGVDKHVIEFKLTEVQEDYVVERVVEMISIIKA